MHLFSRYPSTLKMGTASSSETVVPVYHSAQGDVTKDIILKDVSSYAMGILT
jgi:hypothetical protein